MKIFSILTYKIQIRSCPPNPTIVEVPYLIQGCSFLFYESSDLGTPWKKLDELSYC